MPEHLLLGVLLLREVLVLLEELVETLLEKQEPSHLVVLALKHFEEAALLLEDLLAELTPLVEELAQVLVHFLSVVRLGFVPQSQKHLTLRPLQQLLHRDAAHCLAADTRRELREGPLADRLDGMGGFVTQRFLLP